MKKLFIEHTGSRVLFISMLTYSVLIIGFFHYQRLTGDATIYLSIAGKYLAGDINNAINGYWGPLLSWLMIPFLALGATHVITINALNLVFGLLTIVGIWKLSFRFEISSNLRLFVIIPAVPILLFVSIMQPMDFLLLCVLIYYFISIFNRDYPLKLTNAATCGILGTLAYLSKPYGLPFFISHFLLMNICHYLRASTDLKNKVLKNCIAGFLIFSLLSGAWIALISYKYGHMTFSNQGKGVFRSLGPGGGHNTLEKMDPIFFEGFFEPPNETAFIIYEDPSHARKKDWSPFESKQSFAHFLRNLSENVFEAVRIYESFSRLAFAIMIAYLLLICVQPGRKLLNNTSLIYPFLTVILYTGGYMPFHFETRYLWIINILLLLMGGHVLNVLYQTEFFIKPSTKNILTALFVLSFIVTPVKTSLDIGHNNINQTMYILGSELNSRYNIRGNIASNRQKIHTEMHDSWHYTFRLAYWLKSRYFGMPREDISDDELLQELKKHDIDFYFFWGNSETAPEFLFRYKELTGGEIPKLNIFVLREHI